ncbi:MAG: hypothetical protein COZ06_28180 [Armatimonadetes bacterium CG_4_10_14_3_um_filter_66_18]|nr:hypothetical protein [Armatimonadota bacterium]OIO92325.1 MAG: hypothetical protein AUJ96_32450 [Armatimonadetes bacterium CG2_30_66_41]PIX44487.1 MAG: hypothetical protein COZ57_17445 [Armatimonadetes bacterium CG_4_8_14_3_um_filter_66_20]PIY40422.1 MAG: hypothetical protein COZ06_28180 [Armatimonadetes bacterium CG_4_10_14_3_um_filter_66_18]PJB69452.1 MAG: hypothetical protein CO096_13095 [Armatimonadetes bacterium CG_4_9_14_3_um_filter_66_14]
MRKRLTIAVLLALLCVAGYWRFHSPRPTPESQIRRLLAKAEQGAESKSAWVCLSCVSPEYTDSLGNDYRTLRQLAVGGFRAVDAVDVTVDVHETTVNGDHARVSARVQIQAAQRDQPVEASDAETVVHLVREKRGFRREWKVLRIDGWELPNVEPY